MTYDNPISKCLLDLSKSSIRFIGGHKSINLFKCVFIKEDIESFPGS